MERTGTFLAERIPGYWKKLQTNATIEKKKFKEEFIQRAIANGKSRDQAISAFHQAQKLFHK